MSAPASDPPKAAGIWAALLAFQAEAPVLPKDKEATVPTKNGGRYTYRYTDLGTINEKVGPLLRKHGLVWTTTPGGTHAEPTLGYTLAHAPTGEQIAGVMPLFGVETSQSHGSAQTYGRRYSKVDVLDLVADEDDDGAAASGAEAAAPGVDMRERATGLTIAQINSAREAVGLHKTNDPGSIVWIPIEKADAFAKALDEARAS